MMAITRLSPASYTAARPTTQNAHRSPWGPVQGGAGSPVRLARKRAVGAALASVPFHRRSIWLPHLTLRRSMQADGLCQPLNSR